MNFWKFSKGKFDWREEVWVFEIFSPSLPFSFSASISIWTRTFPWIWNYAYVFDFFPSSLYVTSLFPLTWTTLSNHVNWISPSCSGSFLFPFSFRTILFQISCSLVIGTFNFFQTSNASLLFHFYDEIKDVILWEDTLVRAEQDIYCCTAHHFRSFLARKTNYFFLPSLNRFLDGILHPKVVVSFSSLASCIAV